MKRIYADSMFQHCYEMGYDSKVNGANEKNSHFNLFTSPDRKKASAYSILHIQPAGELNDYKANVTDLTSSMIEKSNKG